MILHETQTVQIAEADWTDDGTVELLTFPTTGEHRTHMSPETARALARQLNQAAAEAEKAEGEVNAQRAHRALQHGFDVDSNLSDTEIGYVRVEGHGWYGILHREKDRIAIFPAPVTDSFFETVIREGFDSYWSQPSHEREWWVSA